MAPKIFVFMNGLLAKLEPSTIVPKQIDLLKGGLSLRKGLWGSKVTKKARQ